MGRNNNNNNNDNNNGDRRREQQRQRLRQRVQQREHAKTLSSAMCLQMLATLGVPPPKVQVPPESRLTSLDCDAVRILASYGLVDTIRHGNWKQLPNEQAYRASHSLPEGLWWRTVLALADICKDDTTTPEAPASAYRGDYGPWTFVLYAPPRLLSHSVTHAVYMAIYVLKTPWGEVVVGPTLVECNDPLVSLVSYVHRAIHLCALHSLAEYRLSLIRLVHGDRKGADRVVQELQAYLDDMRATVQTACDDFQRELEIRRPMSRRARQLRAVVTES